MLMSACRIQKKQQVTAKPACNWTITISFKVFSFQRYPKRRKTRSVPRNFLGHAPRHREQYPKHFSKRSPPATNSELNCIFFFYAITNDGIYFGWDAHYIPGWYLRNDIVTTVENICFVVNNNLPECVVYVRWPHMESSLKLYAAA